MLVKAQKVSAVGNILFSVKAREYIKHISMFDLGSHVLACSGQLTVMPYKQESVYHVIYEHKSQSRNSCFYKPVRVCMLSASKTSCLWMSFRG